MNVAMILAGGTGSRIGAGIPKQFIKVLDKPILAYTVELFQKNENIDAIEIVSHNDWKDEVRNIVDTYGLTKVRWIADGGNTFQESTLNGISHLNDKLQKDDIIVISFGVAPMTTQEEIDDSIRVAKEHGNGISAAPMDLLTCIKDDEYSSVTTIPRDDVKGFSNPWSFNYGELCESIEKGRELGLLETVEPHITSLYFALGKRIWFSKSDRRDVKITFKEDLDTFEGYLLLQQKRAIDFK